MSEPNKRKNSNEEKIPLNQIFHLETNDILPQNDFEKKHKIEEITKKSKTNEEEKNSKKPKTKEKPKKSNLEIKEIPKNEGKKKEIISKKSTTETKKNTLQNNEIHVDLNPSKPLKDTNNSKNKKKRRSFEELTIEIDNDFDPEEDEPIEPIKSKLFNISTPKKCKIDKSW